MFVCRCVLRFACLCLAVSLTPAALGQSPDQARKAIQERYNRENAAFAKNEGTVYFTDLAPTFVHVSTKGVQTNNKEMQKAIAELLAVARSINTKTVIQKLKLKPHVAVVIFEQHTECRVIDPKANTSSSLIQDIVGEDTWTESANGWRRTRTKELSNTIKAPTEPAK